MILPKYYQGQIFFTNPPDNYVFDLENPGEDEYADTYYLPLEVDTEYWQPSLSRIIGNDDYDGFHKLTLTVQYRGLLDSVGAIFCHPDIDPLRVGEDITRHPILRHGLSFVDYINTTGLVASCSRSKASVNHKQTIHVHLYGFFLVAELYRIFTWEYLDDINGMVLSTGRCKISQSRRLVAETRGSYYDPSILMSKWTITVQDIPFNVKLTFHDTCAVHGMSSYADFCANTGVILKHKDNFTSEEKAEMVENYTDKPDKFDPYALTDVSGNYQALVNNAEMFKTIHKSLGVLDYYELPRLTIGATIARLFTTCLLNRTGITEKKKLEEYLKFSNYDKLKTYRSTTALYLAKVDGGRCRNNRPSDVCIKNPIADIDISGCYGEGLRNQIYPIGRPCIIDYPLRSKQNDYLTLRDFLSKYSNELLPGLWKARVSCKEEYKLKYRQDFLISWYPPKDLNKLMKTDTELESVEWWSEENVGMTKIFTNEVNLAIINHDFIQWLDHVCSAKQRKELLDNLIVNCAMFYPASKRVESTDELLNAYANHKGKNTCEIDLGIKKVIEAECHAWLGIEMSDLIVDTLLLERKKHPKKTPLNTLYKLCINTIYGDMVSPFFSCGNTCVGDNITARARAMAWYMEKGLNGFSTITDGCPFELNRVSTPNGKRSITAEGFTPMHDKCDSYNYAPLGGEKWEIIDWIDNKAVVKRGDIQLTNDEAKKLIDELAITHLQKLFPSVDVLCFKTTDINGNERVGQYGFETKDIYAGATFHGSANHAFFDNQGNVIDFKMRSYRKQATTGIILEEDDLEVENTTYEPAKTFLKAIYDDSEGMERQLPFIHSKILKLGEFTANYEARFKDSPLHPGCTIEIPRLLRECSLAQFTFATKVQWDNWEKQADSIRDKTGQTYESKFLNGEKLNYKKMVRELDEIIRAGEMLIPANGKMYKSLGEHKHLAALEKVRAMFYYLFGFRADENDDH